MSRRKIQKLVHTYDPFGISGYGQFIIKINDEAGTPFYTVPLPFTSSEKEKWFRKSQAEKRAQFICDLFDVVKETKPIVIAEFEAFMSVTIDQIED